jgi:Domain of unknown function (DUF6265)
MRKLFVLCALSCLVSSAHCQSVSSSEFSKLSWLAGNWTLINPKSGRSGTERWTKVSGSEWRGFGVSMRGNDTLFVENLKIVQKDSGIYYVADVPENKALVYFKFSRISDSSFECENPVHDFPKKITYSQEGHILRATISGNGKSVEYLFRKK